MIKVGIFGTGLMARIYSQIIAQTPMAQLVGVVGNSVEKTKNFSAEFKIPGYSGSAYKEFFTKHPEVDTVIIATPEWVREEPLQAAVTEKKNILLEKPFCDSWEKAKTFKKILTNYPKVFEICHVLRHSPRFYSLKQSIDQGKIGEIRHFYSRRNSNLNRVKRVFGKTDLAFWLTPHDLDLIRWIAKSDVNQVYAVSKNKLKSEDDYLIANVTLKNGVHVVSEVSWCTPPISGTAREALFEIWGTQGSVELEDFNMNVKFFSSEGKVETPDTYEHYDVDGFKGGIFKNTLDYFLESVRLNRRSDESIRSAFEVSLACSMIRKSLDEGRIVSRKEFE